MKRGEVWTVSAGGPYTGKPPPSVIVQEDRFKGTNSITLCAFTTDPTEAPLLRMLVEPTDKNGLSIASRLMIDKSRMAFASITGIGVKSPLSYSQRHR
jgi:mRNA interferase MazF